VRRALLTVVLALVVNDAAAEAWIVIGRVVGISDGDTITLLDRANAQHKIRLSGIDAPERGQAFGERSKQNLAMLVFEKQVEARCQKRDRYGREVCSVFVGSRDTGLEQVRAGLAWHYKRFENEQSPAERVEFADAEERARAARMGLWSEKNPTSPWEWRRVRTKE
jgi:endonuclease YncB( thermonuclease family)